MTKYNAETHKQICFDVIKVLDKYPLEISQILTILGDVCASILACEPKCVEHNEQVFFNMITEQTITHIETLNNLKKELQ